jgi:hypothetical protein
MSAVRNIHKGILFSIIAGIFLVFCIVIFFVMGLPLIMWVILLPLILSLFIPGLWFLYKGFPLKYRGLMLIIIDVLTNIPSIIAITITGDDFIIMFNIYVIVSLTLIFIIPALFNFYLEFHKEDVKFVKERLLILIYYVSIVGFAFLVSLSLYGFGFFPRSFIITKFWIILGESFLISLMITGIIFTSISFSRSRIGKTLRQMITAILGLIVGAVSLILILYIFLSP